MHRPPKQHSIVVPARDGRELAGTWYASEEAKAHSLVILPGLAVPQSVLHGFAQFMAIRGWGVLTFDYRGVGKSRKDPENERIDLDDWINLDLPAAMNAVREQSNTRFLAVFAHSIGGQLLGQSPCRTEVDAAVLLAAQRGIPRLFKGRGKLSVYYAYTVFPLLIRLLGRLPASKYTFPVACPAGAVRQWVRWGRRGVFTDREGRNTEYRFAEWTIPITAVTIADDDYAPGPAVDALTQLYTNAAIRGKTIDPTDFGAKEIGHFGFFHRRAPRPLWETAAGWLDEMETGEAEPPGAGQTSPKYR